MVTRVEGFEDDIVEFRDTCLKIADAIPAAFIVGMQAVPCEAACEVTVWFDFAPPSRDLDTLLALEKDVLRFKSIINEYCDERIKEIDRQRESILEEMHGALGDMPDEEK